MGQGVKAGGCLCGAVRFELSPPLRAIIVCHCRQCARWTGHAVAATAVATENFRILTGVAELKWFASSSHAKRGFCAICGSSLLWMPADGSRVSVLAGSLDSPTGLAVGAHVYVVGKPDFYSIAGEAPQFDQGGGGLALPPEYNV